MCQTAPQHAPVPTLPSGERVWVRGRAERRADVRYNRQGFFAPSKRHGEPPPLICCDRRESPWDRHLPRSSEPRTSMRAPRVLPGGEKSSFDEVCRFLRPPFVILKNPAQDAPAIHPLCKRAEHDD